MFARPWAQILSILLLKKQSKLSREWESRQEYLFCQTIAWKGKLSVNSSSLYKKCSGKGIVDNKSPKRYFRPTISQKRMSIGLSLIIRASWMALMLFVSQLAKIGGQFRVLHMLMLLKMVDMNLWLIIKSLAKRIRNISRVLFNCPLRWEQSEEF